MPLERRKWLPSGRVRPWLATGGTPSSISGMVMSRSCKETIRFGCTGTTTFRFRSSVKTCVGSAALTANPTSNSIENSTRIIIP